MATPLSVAAPKRLALAQMTSSRPWQFFAVLPDAHRMLATIWWSLLFLRGLLPAVFAVATGALVGAVTEGTSLTPSLVTVGITFVVLQVLPQLHTAISMNLGSKVSALLNDRLAAATVAPPGIGHLEDPELAADMTTAREFDRGMTGPPMYLNVDFIADSLTQTVAGTLSAAVLLRYSWWAPLVLLVAWLGTHVLLRESGVWKERNTEPVQQARRHADYAFNLAVNPEPAKELRLFGLQEWTISRFTKVRRHLFDLQYQATRLREKSLLGAMLVVVVANLAVFLWLANQAVSAAMTLGTAVTVAQLAIGVQAVAFGGLNWAMDDAAGPVTAVNRLEPARGPAGALRPGAGRTLARRPAAAGQAQGVSLRIRDLHFAYPRTDRPIYAGLDLDIAAGESLAVVGSNGAGKTTLAKLLCRFYDPTSGTIAADGVELRDLDLDNWRTSVTAVFQDLLRLDLSLRDNVDPGRRATDEQVLAALRSAGADGLAELSTPLAKGYPGGIDLSGGQWQRVALARALCAVTTGSRLVLLDEPTANLDVRGESVIFQRLLEATRGATRILISHRFSTVRMADRIAVLTDGVVTELGDHAELMSLGGRYARMFTLQAKRFDASADDEGMGYDVLD
jgi:ATP-binding cassette, subfamily B, bacterial